MFAIVPKGFIPDQDNDSMNINLRAAQGTSYFEMVKNARQVAEIVSRNPYVDTFFVSTGGGTSAMNTARLNVQLTPRRTRPLTAAQVAQQLRPQLSRFPGISGLRQPAAGDPDRRAPGQQQLHADRRERGLREPLRLGVAPGTRDREAARAAGRLGRHGSEEPARGPGGRPRRRGRRGRERERYRKHALRRLRSRSGPPRSTDRRPSTRCCSSSIRKIRSRPTR